jgi:hypothetical protein
MRALCCVLWLACTSSLAAWAQDAKTPPPAARKSSITEEAKKKGPRRVLRLEGDVIEGKAIKPEAFYLLNRTSISFEGLKLETQMVPKILKQLRKPPF